MKVLIVIVKFFSVRRLKKSQKFNLIKWFWKTDFALNILTILLKNVIKLNVVKNSLDSEQKHLVHILLQTNNLGKTQKDRKINIVSL